MMTEQEIRDKYKALHDSETILHYSGEDGRNKEEWDTWHGKLWDDMEAELIAGGYKQPPEPPLIFEPPETGVPEKVEYIEDYLKKLQGR